MKTVFLSGTLITEDLSWKTTLACFLQREQARFPCQSQYFHSWIVSSLRGQTYFISASSQVSTAQWSPQLDFILWTICKIQICIKGWDVAKGNLHFQQTLCFSGSGDHCSKAHSYPTAFFNHTQIKSYIMMTWTFLSKRAKP